MFGSCFGNAVNEKCSLASFRSVYRVAVWNSQCLNGHWEKTVWNSQRLNGHWEKTVQGLLNQKSDSEDGARCGFTVLLCTMKVTVKFCTSHQQLSNMITG